ncbi:E3 ubiquitin-protein ligase PUB23-like [Phragmites australis]|uniref:E3 ubiquitin-protein ligase PUB23-like n=1 Tax=Phragmites australis TaxID=29695 RepID=UPI002D76E89D|nr:E3 ubiquitin-protein ligase PUB23-like [Phragmites australis]
MEATGGMRRHLLCPISLQPMQDPVTAPTGITYDRCAIERWLAAGHDTCPVTGQPLSLANLTPNHTLRRLIQSWRPNSTPVEREQPDVAADVVKKLLSSASCPPVDVLCKAAEVASESEVARRYMVDAGVLQRVLRLVVSCAKNKSSPGDQGSFDIPTTVEACLALIRALDVSGDELRPLVVDSHDLVDALTDVLVAFEPGPGGAARASAVQLLESVTEEASASVLGRLRLELFRAVTAVVRDRLSPGATRAALCALLHACPVGRNRALIVEAGAVHEAIELELAAPSSPGFGAGDRRVTELTMALLAELCACADGRAAVAAHPAGIAVVARRLLRVSAGADACAVRVLAAVSGRAASPETLREMARVGAVGKLCCVLQADCDASVKEAARAVLRLHSALWSGSPCVSAYLLSRYL